MKKFKFFDNKSNRPNLIRNNEMSDIYFYIYDFLRNTYNTDAFECNKMYDIFDRHNSHVRFMVRRTIETIRVTDFELVRTFVVYFNIGFNVYEFIFRTDSDLTYIDNIEISLSNNLEVINVYILYGGI